MDRKRKKLIRDLLKQADESLAEAGRRLARRDSRGAVLYSRRASGQALSALWLAQGLPAPDLEYERDWRGPLEAQLSKFQAAFFRQLNLAGLRLEASPKSQMHVEEAAGWLRKAQDFVFRLRKDPRLSLG